MNTTEMQNQIKQYINQLSPEKLQVAAYFLAYLAEKYNKELNQFNSNNSEKSALELAEDIVGCVDAPSDLSTNKDYLKGFGEL
ncbi:hypothetical protein C7H19_08605 [Aphanothece hegewaldii CCALA 016]|uniref:DUF2281 domain-containing protein n=1 Tax=Aphanothece hegewaldii CCALA 016 TaxID=2107694 RepID=A0A2T1LZ07_9CHRO|nr:hypothetical protein [Aphanothece hegewaldii]PSF37608.1 hypothetical protein C7H19_08605 [Aphanothece hegewaldii CCALA 016]